MSDNNIHFQVMDNMRLTSKVAYTVISMFSSDRHVELSISSSPHAIKNLILSQALLHNDVASVPGDVFEQFSLP
jgi:hypothetical protein